MEPVSERIILQVWLKHHTDFLSLITVYASTNEPMSEEECVAFYIYILDTIDLCIASYQERHAADNG